MKSRNDNSPNNKRYLPGKDKNQLAKPARHHSTNTTPAENSPSSRRLPSDDSASVKLYRSDDERGNRLSDREEASRPAKRARTDSTTTNTLPARNNPSTSRKRSLDPSLHESENYNRNPLNRQNDEGFQPPKRARQLTNTTNSLRNPSGDLNIKHLMNEALNQSTSDAFTKLATQLKTIRLTPEQSNTLLRELTLYIKKDKGLCPALPELASLAASHLAASFIENSDQISPFTEWVMQYKSPQGRLVAFLIYNLGKLAEHQLINLYLSAEDLHYLLRSLSQSSGLSPEDIGRSFQGLGLLSKHNKLDGVLNTKLLGNLLEKFPRLREDSHGITNSLYNLGILAKENKLESKFDISLMVALLQQLRSCKKLISQGISTSIYGLGLLAQGDKLEGQLSDITLVVELLKRLLSDQELKPQGIANSLYGLGEVAQTGQLKGLINITLIEALLQRFNSDGLKAQHIGNSLQALGLLAKSGNLEGELDVACIEPLLTHFFEFNTDLRGIANSLYGLGLLAQAGKLGGKWNLTLINKLLNLFLPVLDDSQSVANSLYGLGLLGQAGVFNGTIDVTCILTMVQSLLQNSNHSAQQLGNSAYGLGLLAQANLLQQSFDIKLIVDLLQRLSQFPEDTLAIVQSLYGLGLIAQAGKLQGKLDAHVIETQLQQLSLDKKLNSLSISKSLYGCGLTAQADLLEDLIDVKPVNALLEQSSSSSKLEPLYIADSLCGVALLVQRGKLDGELHCEPLVTLLKKLDDLSVNPHDKAVSIYSLGLIAQSGSLQNLGSLPCMDSLLQKLSSSPKLHYKDISISLYGLGVMAKAKVLQNDIDAKSINALLEQLLTPPEDTQAISNSLYSVGLLAQASKIKGELKEGLINRLLEKLSERPELEPRSIANSLYGIGFIAIKGKLGEPLSANLIDGLLRRVTVRPFIIQDIANSLFGVGLIAKNGQLQNKLDGNQIDDLLKQLKAVKPEIKHTKQALFSMATLSNHLTALPSVETITWFAEQSINRPYLHPLEIVELINHFAAFKSQAGALNEPLMALVNAFPTRIFNRLPKHVNEKLLDTINDLESVPLWKTALQKLKNPLQVILTGKDTTATVLSESQASTQAFLHTEQPRQVLTAATLEQQLSPPQAANRPNTHRRHLGQSTPRRQAPLADHAIDDTEIDWREALKNQIFNTIANEDLQGLRRLLHLSAAAKMLVKTRSQQAHNDVRSIRNRTPNPGTRSTHDISRQVLNFFMQTKASAFKKLVTKSHASYFTTLLEACTAHTRYQLAQSNALHPVLLYLPLAELKQFIQKLLSPFQLYRDLAPKNRTLY